MKAHPTALVDPKASIAEDVEIGPFCIIGPEARIGPGCRLGPRVTVQGPSVIGRDNQFHAHVSIGRAGGGRVEIGDANVFRESSHVDAPPAAGITRLGSRNRLGAWAAVSGGSSIGSDVRLGAFSVIGENGLVEDGVQVEGQCVVDENRRLGKGSRIRSQIPVSADVPPFMVLDGNPSSVQSPNPAYGSAALLKAYEIAFSDGLAYPEAARRIAALKDATPEVATLAEFLRSSKSPEADGE